MLIETQTLELHGGWKLSVQTLVWRYGGRENQGVTVYRFNRFCSHFVNLAAAINFVNLVGYDPRVHSSKQKKP